jgi:hypothetical protein
VRRGTNEVSIVSGKTPGQDVSAGLAHRHDQIANWVTVASFRGGCSAAFTFNPALSHRLAFLLILSVPPRYHGANFCLTPGAIFFSVRFSGTARTAKFPLR